MAILWSIAWLIGSFLIGFFVNSLLVKTTGNVSRSLGNFFIGCATGPLGVMGGLHSNARAKGETPAFVSGGIIGTLAYLYFFGVF